jgi:hypothetical protein
MERLAGEIRRERDAIAALRAEWALLGSPARIQGLVERHLALRMLDPAQIDHLDHLPERPVPPGPQPDAIAAMIDSWETDVEKRTDPTPTPPIAGGAR